MTHWVQAVLACELRGRASPPAAPRACVSIRAQELANNIADAYYRLEPFLRQALREFVRQVRRRRLRHHPCRRPASLNAVCRPGSPIPACTRCLPCRAQHLDSYVEMDNGGEKEFWISFYNLQAGARACVSELQREAALEPSVLQQQQGLVSGVGQQGGMRANI